MPCTCAAGCEACSPPPPIPPTTTPPPGVPAARWRTLLDVCRQFDDRANHGAAPMREDDR